MIQHLWKRLIHRHVYVVDPKLTGASYIVTFGQSKKTYFKCRCGKVKA